MYSHKLQTLFEPTSVPSPRGRCKQLTIRWDHGALAMRLSIYPQHSGTSQSRGLDTSRSVLDPMGTQVVALPPCNGLRLLIWGS